MLRDRLVCGVNDDRIQKAVLQESKTLTFEKALEIAHGIEEAIANAKHFTSSTVQRVQHQRRPQTRSRLSPQSTPRQPCYRCGETSHFQMNCRFRNSKCAACDKLGHIAKVCRSKQKPNRQSQVNHVISKDESPPPVATADHQSPADTYSLFTIRGKAQPIVVPVCLNQVELSMELDTGASLSLTTETTYRKLSLPGQQPNPTTICLRTYTKVEVPVIGSVDVEVKYESQVFTLPVIVVKGDGPNLFGRDWLNSIKLNWQKITNLTQDNLTLDDVLQKHTPVFSEKLGLLRGTKAKIVLSHAQKLQCFWVSRSNN